MQQNSAHEPVEYPLHQPRRLRSWLYSHVVSPHIPATPIPPGNSPIRQAAMLRTTGAMPRLDPLPGPLQQVEFAPVSEPLAESVLDIPQLVQSLKDEYAKRTSEPLVIGPNSQPLEAVTPEPRHNWLEENVPGPEPFLVKKPVQEDRSLADLPTNELNPDLLADTLAAVNPEMYRILMKRKTERQ